MKIEHLVGALWMRDDGRQACRLDRLGEQHCRAERAREGKLHEHGGQSAERVAGRILGEELARRGELEPEAEIESERRRLQRHVRVDEPDRCLPLLGEGELGPDVRRREEHVRSARDCLTAEHEALGHRLGAVVTGRDDVRMHVDEHVFTLPTSAVSYGSYSARR